MLTPTPRRGARPSFFRLEPLDARDTPVVGALAEAPIADVGSVFDGVVQVHVGDSLGSGALLYTGRHVLTAAHVVDDNGDQVADDPVTVRFDMEGRSIDMVVEPDQVVVWPAWAGFGPDGLSETGADDIAMLYLPALAPSGPEGTGAGRFDLYREFDEVGQTYLAVGYGRAGVGEDGEVEGTYGEKRSGYNVFETTGLIGDEDYLVPPEYGLVSDFDDGTAEHDALGRALGLTDLGLGADEASVATGDSGGPAFLYDGTNYLIAGIIVALSTGGDADSDQDFGFAPTTNASFGDLAGFTRVSAYADGIDTLAADPYDLVLDLTDQLVGGDGTADTVQITEGDGVVGVYVNGDLYHSDFTDRLRSVTVYASGDGGSFDVDAAVSPALYVAQSGFADAVDNRPTVTAVAPGEPRPVAPERQPEDPDRLLAVGAGDGSEPRVRVYDPDGSVRTDLVAFGSEVTGGVRVALGDVNGDGYPDLIAGAGPGGPPAVRVFDGRTDAVLEDFLAFEESFTGGVYVASGDYDGDGRDDVVLTPDEGGGPRVRVLTGVGQRVIADFFGIEDPNFRGGARVAAGDLNGDLFDDLLVGAGFGGGPRLAAFDGSRLTAARPADALPAKLFADFFVFEETLRNGVFPAAGDLDIDQADDLIVGGGPGGGPRVYALSGRDLTASGAQVQLANFFAGDPASRGGVRLTATDLDGDGYADIAAGAGEGEEGRVSVYVGARTEPDGVPPVYLALEEFAGLTDGVYVG